MKPPPLLVHVAVLLGTAFIAAYAAAAADPQPERRRELVSMVRQDCGSCHGLTLSGGLGPALLPHTLAGKPVDSMVATVMNGRPGTAMPGWARFLSEPEAEWVVRTLMAGFPADGVGR
ncbi:c-type cytochrome [Pseudothauera rhizosphaerae]|uniref:Cytochrome c n=1 Tax=Pseudothauera rhizosphaerae TaxID=2565932 RepID=A0A4S4AG29_9RHOO|nr:cytochrome c [Pseudothauera rhizosphaerae]THF57228.1 cytochrome c [Pseudothauera rhizosphaerae]